MKKQTRTKKITIDTLAVMVAEGFDGVGKKFDIIEKKMATKKDLKNLEARMATKTDLDTQQKTLKTHGDVLQIMLKEIKAVHEDSKSFRENISTLYTDHLAYDRKIDNLKVRVETLEKK